MGGVEVIGAGGDGWTGDDVYNLLMQAALVRGGAVASWAADLSAGGSDVLDARYVAFDSVVLEMLDYHSKEAALQRSLLGVGKKEYPTSSDSNVAPSVVGNMHVSFNVRPEQNLNEFVTELERTAHSLGFHEEENNSYAVLEGSFEGWSLAYCKGPDGEQLEFNQVVGSASAAFAQALKTYFAGGENPIW